MLLAAAEFMLLVWLPLPSFSPSITDAMPCAIRDWFIWGHGEFSGGRPNRETVH